MAMSAPPSWDLLDEKEELELHRLRLLNVEEKPFKRITKRLTNLTAIAAAPPPSHPNPAAALEAGLTEPQLEVLREDLLLDLAAFDSSIARLQFLLDANERERDRYAADRRRIAAESAAVRASNADLRQQLDDARAALTRRKKFDELADAITENRALRPREDQHAALAKLAEECAELERESEAYKVTWRERRDQFGRIVEEGMNLRRLIRDEKEEVERREGMSGEEGGEDGGGGGDGAALRPAGAGAPAVAMSAAYEPASAGGRTPATAADSPVESGIGTGIGHGGLRPGPSGRAGSVSRSGSPSVGPSRAQTAEPEPEPEPVVSDMDDADDGEVLEERQAGPGARPGAEDVEMGDEDDEDEEGRIVEPPRITVDRPGERGADDLMDLDGR